MRSESRPLLSADRNPHGDGRYIPILDGWRAVAIILVLLFHGLLNTRLENTPALLLLARIAARTGALGVLIFFCISGYLITHRLLVESGASGMFSLRTFYIKRVFRILPPLIAYLLAAALLSLFGIIHLVRGDWVAAAFLTNYAPGSWYTSHFWSLSVEEHFYLFWPVCIVLCGWRRAMWIGIGVVTVIAIWRPLHLHELPSSEWPAVLRHTDMRVDYIMFGAILALAVHLYPGLVSVFQRLGSNLWLGVLLLAFYGTVAVLWLDLRTIQAILLTLLVCCSAIADSSAPRVLLTSRPMLSVGKISYSLYVWQELILGPSTNRSWSSPLALPLRYVLCFTAAYVSYHLVERPFIRYGRSLLPTRHSPTTAASPGHHVRPNA